MDITLSLNITMLMDITMLVSAGKQEKSSVTAITNQATDSMTCIPRHINAKSDVEVTKVVGKDAEVVMVCI